MSGQAGHCKQTWIVSFPATVLQWTLSLTKKGCRGKWKIKWLEYSFPERAISTMTLLQTQTATVLPYHHYIQSLFQTITQHCVYSSQAEKFKMERGANWVEV